MVYYWFTHIIGFARVKILSWPSGTWLAKLWNCSALLRGHAANKNGDLSHSKKKARHSSTDTHQNLWIHKWFRQRRVSPFFWKQSERLSSNMHLPAKGVCVIGFSPISLHHLATMPCQWVHVSILIAPRFLQRKGGWWGGRRAHCRKAHVLDCLFKIILSIPIWDLLPFLELGSSPIDPAYPKKNWTLPATCRRFPPDFGLVSKHVHEDTSPARSLMFHHYGSMILFIMLFSFATSFGMIYTILSTFQFFPLDDIFYFLICSSYNCYQMVRKLQVAPTGSPLFIGNIRIPLQLWTALSLAW